MRIYLTATVCELITVRHVITSSLSYVQIACRESEQGLPLVKWRTEIDLPKVAVGEILR